MWKRDVAFDNIKVEIQRIYDSGRPEMNLVVRMILEISGEEYPNYYGKDIYSHDYH